MILIVATGAGASAQPGEGSSIAGLWATGSQGGRVELYHCGLAIRGKMDDAAPLRANPDQRDIKNPDRTLRNRRLKGLIVLYGFTGGPKLWKVYDPETGEGAVKDYLTLREDGKLEVKSCKVAIFCRTKVWTRVR